MKECFLSEKEKIYYKKNDFKPGSQTIVFVHGLSGSSSAWNFYEKALKKTKNIISIDLRGHGKSFRPRNFSDYSIKNSCEDLYNIIRKEKISDFIIISHSFGNLITFEFMKNYNNLVKGLILVSPDASPGKRISSYLISPFLKSIGLLLHFPIYKKKGGHIDYKRFIGTGDWNIRRSLADINNTGIRSYVFSTINAQSFNAKNSLNKINIPTMIIHGKKDTIFPISRGLMVHNGIKNSKFKIFEKADHIIVLNERKKLLEEIRNFIKLINS